MARPAFIYDDRFHSYDMGAHHPLKPRRLALTRDLCTAYQLLDPAVSAVITPPMAPLEAVLAVHSRSYIEVIRQLSEGLDVPDMERYGFGPGDNPPFPGMWDASMLYSGGSLAAAEWVISGQGRCAFNPGGGLHHAMSDRAAGFCTLNDPAIAIRWLLERCERVAYIDIDAHHGDGVQAAFYDDPRVLTVSYHETGETLYPQTGFPVETGSGAGRGYSVNVPLFAGTTDEIYLWAFQEVVPPLMAAFQPDIVVAQLGCDSHFQDPLSHLSLSLGGYRELVRVIDSLCGRWVALGGGGYNIDTVPRAWTLAYAVIAQQDLPDAIPAEFAEATGLHHLYDTETPARHIHPDRARAYAEHSVAAVKRLIFPTFGL
jgi:acetoin utilization protein AcuC